MAVTCIKTPRDGATSVGGEPVEGARLETLQDGATSTDGATSIGGEPSSAVVGPSFRTWLPIAILARTTINTSARIIYPFLPALGRGLGISLTAASRLVALRLVAGVGSPLFGPLADRYGRRRVMVAALALFTLASLLLAGVGTIAAAAVAFALYGVAKMLYDTALLAYVGDQVPYSRRARAVGLLELPWAAAWLIGVPASGLLIERLGWRAPWAMLIVLGLAGAVLTQLGVPPASRAAARPTGRQFVASMVATWRGLLRRRSVLVLLLASMLVMLGIEIPFIVYGAWLETAFGLSLTALGLASTVVGVAEAVAEFGTAVVTDRLGKRRSVLVGLVGLAASLVALPWLSRLGLGAALAGVAAMMLSFEFAVVSLLPLATELAPEARASLLSLNMAAFSASRAIGGLIGGWLWHWQSMALQTGVGAACALLAALLLVWGMTDLK